MASSACCVYESEQRIQMFQEKQRRKLERLKRAYQRFLRSNGLIEETPDKQPVPQLPVEVLEEIFSNLDISQWSKISQVCKTWKSVIDQPRFWKNVVVPLGSSFNADYIEFVSEGKIRKLSVSHSHYPLQSVITKNPHIESIIFNHLCGLSDSFIHSGFEYPVPSLKELIGPGCLDLRLDTLFRIVDKCKNLETLSLTAFKASDFWIEIIAKNLKKLKHFSINSCLNLTKAGIEKLVLNNGSFELLSFENCRKIDDESLSFISTLKHLKYLNLRGCFKITNNGLQHLSKMQSLRVLCLDSCTHINYVGLSHLKDMGITSLDISRCVLINDKALEAIADGLLNLRKLVMCVEQIPLSCWPEVQGLVISLKKLKVKSHLFNIRKEALYESLRLRSLHSRGSGNSRSKRVGADGLKKILLLPCFRILELSG